MSLGDPLPLLSAYYDDALMLRRGAAPADLNVPALHAERDQSVLDD